MKKTAGFNYLLLSLVLFLCAMGCGDTDDETDGDSESNQEDSVETDTVSTDITEEPKPCNLDIGEVCHGDEQCTSNVCLMSEITPFGICTVPCEQAPGYCISDGGEVHENSWCIEIPKDDFKSLNHKSMNRFCMRTCSDLDSCQEIAPGYAVCANMEYQGNPLYPTDPKWVCQAPDAIGKTPVDPVTCAGWKSENPGYSSEKLLCQNFCHYLNVCQYYEAGHNLECCEWYCFLELTKGGQTNEPYKDQLTNFTMYYQTHKNSIEACTGETHFGYSPDIPDSDAPLPADVICH